ncbi:efflux RND transporter periplasmic adaptor subunit [Marinibacterium profundimaris]|uniref:Membrane protein n=1 Tax=Marinibacterium profundimaris TaxID=1679460 RepID=A0A225NH24_9RHOB|nr:HlyD family secretion protein [Marinibacterium profundimaris]OWU69968.1 membrane protein [Marinibacterium profundimaris]
MTTWITRNGGRVALTAAMLACAGVLGQSFWDYYMNAPWTRDGRVSADSVRIAPQVSGTIESVDVADNDFVHKGDLLYRISPESFELAVERARTTLDSERESMEFKASVADRASRLKDAGTISAESIEEALHDAAAARADVRGAEVALEMAQLDLERTEVRAPVDGYVTNLRLRPGDYAVAGSPSITVIDEDSFGVTGYFRETQFERIHVGDTVRIKLMGTPDTITGHVESLGHGIADDNGATDAYGLPAVDPVLDWVRLAQRIPVRIEMDRIPDRAFLAAGMTASLTIGDTPDPAR